MIAEKIRIRMLTPEQRTIKIKMSEDAPRVINVKMKDYGRGAYHPKYEGNYIFTPSRETQTVPTADKILEQDIVINPIPKNYGLITWNGSSLRVS